MLVDDIYIGQMEQPEKQKMKVKDRKQMQPWNVTCTVSNRKNCNIKNVEEQVNNMLEKTDYGKYKCKVCGKTAVVATNIKNHIEHHMEGLLYSCPDCDKTFRSKCTFKVHRVQYHN